MPLSRQCYRVSKAGAMTNMRLTHEQLPAPTAHEIIVEVYSIGLNFADIFAIMGLYSATPKGSFVPGLEYAGRVIAVGERVTRARVGERVMGVIRFGAYTSHLVIDENYVLPLPDDWSFDEGAAFLVQALTAYYALFPLGAMKQGATVLIHSAAGGVGLMANRIAKKFDAFTIGTIGSPHKSELLRLEGYDRIIVRSKGDNYAEMTQSLTSALQKEDGSKRALTLVLDSIGGKTLRASYDLLAPMGRAVCFGSAHLAFPGKRPPYLSLGWKYIQRPKFDPLDMIENNKAVMGFNLIWLWENLGEMHSMIQMLDALHLPKPLVGHTYPFEQLPEALAVFQTGMTVGKVVVQLRS
ncbi:MAG: zinc-binding dehydrogenase [Candidatus Kapaibacterium sp.]|nr:MAG: zinc-binding dehydrogenase [Candidatus Kapabacteria bacterium]